MQILSLSLLALASVARGQLAGSVGPSTSASDKGQSKTCNVQDYGAKADKSTDIGPAIESAWDECKEGGVVYIPPGDYALGSWVTLTGGKGTALQLDGILYRTGDDGGNMVMIEHTSDFELFSSTARGAIQGSGYEFHSDGSLSGPRILRLYEVDDFSIHDLALVDSPAFHLSLDTCSNGELYNLIIRGGDSGGLDGIDIWSENIWVHDVEVTNKDECVTVKSPAHNILVENIYCNWSGGCAMGSLGSDTNISDIYYRNIYTWQSNQMFMVKSNGGSGSVSNLLLENFIGHANAYSLNIDSQWSSMDAVEGDGVSMQNVTVRNWKGGEEDGAQRGPIKVVCAAGAPCTDVTIEGFAMWTESGDQQSYVCENAFGTGACLENGDDSTASYASTVAATATPSGFAAPRMRDDLTSAFSTDASIPIPTLPASYFPGVKPISARASGSLVASASASVTPSATPSGSV
ncbi:RGase A [Aspergillus affinis]|uniref:RGase A n=1 Tax=Aspergillus affinis TaxID=1070780 RepID=UPI0022FF092D|nr:RGase A [Aspergillus affinis]KAI9043570.1 RGase A [Aspergillus affinis]